MKQSIHISDVIQFLQCRRSWDLSSNLRQHLTPKKPYEPFTFGTVVHKIWEHNYAVKSGWIDPEIFLLDYEWPQIPGAIPEFIDFGKELYQEYLKWQAAYGTTKDLNRGDYFADYQMTWLGLEQDFTVPIFTPLGNRSSRFMFDGTIDGIFRHKIDGKLYLHEIKTTSSIDSRIPQLQFELQPTAYMYAMELVYQEPIAGVVYTLIRKKLPDTPDILKDGTLSKNKGIDTTPETYIEAIRTHHRGITKEQIKLLYGDIIQKLANQPNKFFRRVLVKRSRSELDQFKKNLYWLARDMTSPHISLYQNPGYFCGNCLFQQPCIMMSQGQSITAHLQEQYQRNTRLDR